MKNTIINVTLAAVFIVFYPLNISAEALCDQTNRRVTLVSDHAQLVSIYLTPIIDDLFANNTQPTNAQCEIDAIKAVTLTNATSDYHNAFEQLNGREIFIFPQNFLAHNLAQSIVQHARITFGNIAHTCNNYDAHIAAQFENEIHQKALAAIKSQEAGCLSPFVGKQLRELILESLYNAF